MTTSSAQNDSFQERRLSALIAPAFFPVHRAVREGACTHFWLSGGRGSGKSSFVAVEILLGMMRDPSANAVIYRKVKDTLKDSVFSQLLWAAELLGVAPLWRSTLSPLRLYYLPTGQRIVFRGLDRANKSKSIRPLKGYFKYLWFEELDEFCGMGELRSVWQSVLRGGERFCCFYTYNPPRSRGNWVNEEASKDIPGRLRHHSDYRTMPRQWLGEPFFEEASRLKEENPQLYRHEYLGEAIGTGNEVFHNLVLREVSEEEISRYGHLYRGLDFGYASDPSHYAVCHYDAARRELVLFDEEHLFHSSTTELAEKILAEMKRHGRGNVCCDSADPRSIDDLYLLGVPAYGARKGPGSVGWGMRFLSEEVRQIIIDPRRCPNTRREFEGYAYPLGADGQPLAEYPDRDNHAIDAVRYALEGMIRARFARTRREPAAQKPG